MKIFVTCAIVEKEGHVLLTQRSEQMPDSLLWEFPGGKLEAGETEEECLIREIKEELNITIRPEKRLTAVVHATPAKEIELIPFVCSYKGGTIQLLEHRAFEWTVPKELPRYNWCLPDVPIVEEYLRLRGDR